MVPIYLAHFTPRCMYTPYIVCKLNWLLAEVVPVLTVVVLSSTCR